MNSDNWVIENLHSEYKRVPRNNKSIIVAYGPNHTQHLLRYMCLKLEDIFGVTNIAHKSHACFGANPDGPGVAGSASIDLPGGSPPYIANRALDKVLLENPIIRAKYIAFFEDRIDIQITINKTTKQKRLNFLICWKNHGFMTKKAT